MPLPRFSPFTSPFDQVRVQDLEVLREIQEGWYIEYKRELPSIKSIAKSIAAFANHYGGWLFYGIAQASPENPVAGAFPGLKTTDVALAQQRIREAASAHVHPPPYFEIRVLSGPCNELGLADDHAILVILVPQGLDAPYVHSGGAIYRRLADKSDPKAETDRSTLDLLWQRGQAHRDRLVRFLESASQLPQGEPDTTVAHVFLFSEALDPLASRPKMTFARFAELMRDTSGPAHSMDFENAFPMPAGFVARHVHTNDPARLTSTWKYYGQGNSVVSIPLSSVTIGPGRVDVYQFLQGYDHADDFIRHLTASGISNGTVVDLNVLHAVFASVVNKNTLLMREEGVTTQPLVKVRLCCTRGRVPFLDSPRYIEYVQRHGLPVVQESDAYSPSGVEPQSFRELFVPTPIDGASEAEQRVGEVLLQGLVLLAYVAKAMGIDHDLVLSASDELHGLGQRAMLAQGFRSTGGGRRHPTDSSVDT